MRLNEILTDEVMLAFESEEHAELNEAAVRAFKRYAEKIVRRYRCMAGPKKGKLVSKPGACAQRKDPANIRKGRKVMRTKKGIIQRKSKVTKRTAMSKLVKRMNQRLSGKVPKK